MITATKEDLVSLVREGGEEEGEGEWGNGGEGGVERCWGEVNDFLGKSGKKYVVLWSFEGGGGGGRGKLTVSSGMTVFGVEEIDEVFFIYFFSIILFNFYFFSSSPLPPPPPPPLLRNG